MPSTTGTSSKASSRSSGKSNVAYAVVQTGLGAVFLAIWVFIGTQMHNETVMQSVIGVLPMFAAFVLGVLSRYFPGVSSVAKTLRSNMPK